MGRAEEIQFHKTRHGLDIIRRAMNWLAGKGGVGTVGASSTAILVKMLGGEPQESDYPGDAADFGRCLGLLKAVPEFQLWLTDMAKVGPVWAAIIEQWDELEGAYNKGDPIYPMLQRAIGKGWASDPRYNVVLRDGMLSSATLKRSAA